MSVETLTLTDFLLARIAEREDDVRRRGAMAVGHTESCIYEGGWEGTTACDCGAVERALAECAAKRTIVSEYVARLPRETWKVETSITALDFAVACLATVYADHDDFREEWRVPAPLPT